ncbi:hypothetical protein Droror1_Dr00009603 [Drosera rotundifolia]
MTKKVDAAAATVDDGLTSIDAKLASAKREVLVQIVKLAQKRGMSGENGVWKEFLNSIERFGATHSDPARRSPADLLAFLRTFKEESDLKFFARVMQCYSSHDIAKKLLQSQGTESPEQRLVQLTIEHSSYPTDFTFPSYEEGWLVTKLRAKGKRKRSEAVIAVDCEMVLCEDGTEALVKICVVDRELQVKLHEFVNPKKAVADYRTSITGVSANDLDGVTLSLEDIQKSMKKLLSHGTILVGHGLSNDMKALKIDHPKVIDTSYIFKYGGDSMRRRPSLVNLCKSVLGYEVRKKGEPHNCLDDACAAMKLVLAKIEKGFDDDLPLVVEEAVCVPEEDMPKLFIQGIPIDMKSEDLHKVIPGVYTLDQKMLKNGKSRNYSILAIFENQQEALEAYDNINGQERGDSRGRLQKAVPVKLSSGITETIYVHKPVCGGDVDQATTKKRLLEISIETRTSEAEVTEKSKSEMNSCVDHVEEIERLTNQLIQRDREISDLHKIIAALTRKHGL